MIQPLLIFNDWAILILRVVLGVILVVYGWPKIKDLKTNAQNFATTGFKPGMFWGTIVGLVEFVGGVALIIGFLTQVFAFLVFARFLIAILKVNRKKGFIHGYELDLLIAGAALLLMTTGGGIYNLDTYWSLFIY
ncbi:MAG: DoxX family protein [Patescibacteria group bacterium]|nr:DoxX family protein [Patescibacteria group bacterium]